MYNLGIKFEYNQHKSEINREKHGISLEEAKALWLVPSVVMEARTKDEAHFGTPKPERRRAHLRGENAK